MKVICANCGERNEVPDGRRAHEFLCGACEKPLSPSPTQKPGDTSAAVGLIGGALLGAAIGGPVGAVIGGIIGGVLGKDAKGLG